MFIVIHGGNNTAEYLATTMLESHYRVAIIEEDLETVGHLAEVMPSKVTIVHGDGCDPDVQRDAGVGEADLFIALTSHDETNLVACEIAMFSFEVPRCISNVSSPKNREIFTKLGVEVVSSTALISRMVEEEAVTTDMRMVFSLREGDIVMVETKLPTRMRHKDGVYAVNLLKMRDVQLIAVVRDGDFEMINADTLLMPGETIIAAAKSGAEDGFREIIRKL